ncbi:glycosyltransferase [Lacrimispora celerecrescens]|uniref:glycosyltransferase n=1 Tax=Lacrimispora celerecrescens TaxID=29354 RepID=UPI0016468F0F|nr:glycosyltransferase [Lacrimispora celerecrescens]
MKNKKTKILHFSIANSGGGITKYALRIWDAIDKEQFQCDFATMSKKLDFAPQLENQGCKIHYISTYSEQDPIKFEEEINRILDYGYDVLHLHTSWWRGFAVEEIAKKRGVPKVIVHSHNTDVHIPIGMTREEARELHYTWQKKVTEDIATDFWACAKKAADWLYGRNIPKERLKIMPNAIELKKYYFNEDVRLKYREEMGLKDQFVIGMIARFQYQKNHEFAIELFKKLNEKKSNAILLLVGIGELREEIEKTVQKYHLESKVKFLGLRNDIENLLQAMDLFILPSRFEGLPLTLVEAQASGLKSITSEFVTEESEITNDIKRLPLDLDLWEGEALRWGNGYKREDTRKIMRDKGFDIKFQIKEIEKLYRYVENSK